MYERGMRVQWHECHRLPEMPMQNKLARHLEAENFEITPDIFWGDLYVKTSQDVETRKETPEHRWCTPCIGDFFHGGQT